MLIAYVLFLLFGAILLFSLEKISVDIITLLLLIGLIVPGILTPSEAFSGFSNDIIVILASIFVISTGLKDTGVLDWIGDQMKRFAHAGSRKFLIGMMSVVGGSSAFMNNTTITALFTPVVSGLGKKAGVSPSKLLMPLAFASILGGTCTLIGTSTNVAVSGFISQAGMEPIGMFEITPIGLIILVTGILYMVFIGNRMLPNHSASDDKDEESSREYVSEIVILPDSPLISQYVADSDLSILDFKILKVLRNKEAIHPTPDLQLCEGDVLIVSGKVANLIMVREIEGIQIRADRVVKNRDLEWARLRVAEVLVGQLSEAAGRTLKEMDFGSRLGATVLAIFRHGKPIEDEIKNIRLHVGDVLLIQAEASRFAVLQENLGMPVLDERPATTARPWLGISVVAAFLGAVICGSFELLPLSACFLIAAVVSVLIGAVNVERAYQFIDWRLLILIGGMTAFGIAMEKTGTATFLSEVIINTFQPLGIIGILAGFFIVTIILTQPMSNAAAALVVLPVAIKTAEVLGSNPRTFAIGIMLAASVSFIAPLEPSCILVYGPGKYRFMDFVKVGLGLTIILTIVVLALLPVFWPL